MGEVNNYRTIRKMMQFSSPKDFYIVKAICRPKKDGESTLCGTTNNHTRMLRLWTFYSVEEFDKHYTEIRNICRANNARAYFLPQRRNTYLALKALMANTLNSLDDASVNFNRLISSSLCGCHLVADPHHKRWVIDLDRDSDEVMKAAKNWWINAVGFGKPSEDEIFDDFVKYFADKLYQALVSMMRMAPEREFMPNIKIRDYLESDITVLKTPHGKHIVTPPFNREPKAMQKFFGALCPKADWIKPDALTILYAPASKVQVE